MTEEAGPDQSQTRRLNDDELMAALHTYNYVAEQQRIDQEMLEMTELVVLRILAANSEE